MAPHVMKAKTETTQRRWRISRIREISRQVTGVRKGKRCVLFPVIPEILCLRIKGLPNQKLFHDPPGAPGAEDGRKNDQ